MCFIAFAQGPAVTSWLQNTTIKGTYYPKGNPTLTSNDILVNCQKVEYSADYVYVTATGVPAYPTGPFSDGNQSNAENQNAIFKIPLTPSQNTGTLDITTGGNIGVFINGVALFDYRDGVAWNTSTNSLCGGPGNPRCPGPPGTVQAWNRDAVPAEMMGFDCAKGHPANGNYHHHQNPSAFKLDLDVIYTICNTYDAEGLYAIDSTKHSPLIGFAYDGYPIYGAYGYESTDGTGNIVRMKSGYSLRNITTRTHHADGTDVDDGPAVNSTYFLGYFREDYEFKNNTNTSYLDEHNGRFCVTPEYPNGTYAYFATVDEKWNSAYPYVVGPTFYGNWDRRTVTTVDETTTIYTGANSYTQIEMDDLNFNAFPNPSSDLLAIQVIGLVKENLKIKLYDLKGKVVKSKTITAGSTIAYFDLQTIYEGTYIVHISNGTASTTKKILVTK